MIYTGKIYTAAMLEKLRQRLIYFLSDTGVKQNYVAKAVFVTSTTISEFKRNGKRISDELAEQLDRYLTNKGY